jgi:hypothetical protein
MNDQNKAAAHSDIAFMRALAEDGAKASSASGAYLVAAGVIFGSASFIVSAFSGRGLMESGWATPIVYLVAGMMMWLFVRTIRRRMGGDQGTASRAVGAAWRGVGFAVWAIAFAFMAVGFRTEDWRVMRELAPVVVALYGAAWLVAAAVSRQSWMNLVAYGAFATCVLLGWLWPQPTVMGYVLTAAVFGLTALPGLVMLRRARA